MKSIRNIFFVALVIFAAVAAPATIKSVTTVGATASTIITPGPNVHLIVIQNTGSGSVRLTYDGGIVYGLTDPTASLGYLLANGQSLTLTFNGSKQPPVIRAILTTGTTTTLDISTDDGKST